MNYQLAKQEVILYDGDVDLYKSINTDNKIGESIHLTLTSNNIIMVKEDEKNLFKTKKGYTDIISMQDIKKYNNQFQVSQKGSEILIQTIKRNIVFDFDGIIEARKFYEKIINALTGTTVAKRGANKISDALDLVDETLGINTRSTVKGLMENGIKGTIINGIKSKKKK